MAEIQIYGFDVSNFVRSARIACEEKGVEHDLATDLLTAPPDLKSSTKKIDSV